MSEIPQNNDTECTVEYHVMDILNPALHHHDLLQSYVRTRVEIGTDSKDCDDFKESIKEAHLNNITAKSDHYNTHNACHTQDTRKKNNDKKKKEKFNTTIESEMKIQKFRRK